MNLQRFTVALRNRFLFASIDETENRLSSGVQRLNVSEFTECDLSISTPRLITADGSLRSLGAPETIEEW